MSTKVWLTISKKPLLVEPELPAEEATRAAPTTYKTATLVEPPREETDRDRPQVVDGPEEAVELARRLLRKHPPVTDTELEDEFLDHYGGMLLDIHDSLLEALDQRGLAPRKPDPGRFTRLLMRCIKLTQLPPSSDDETAAEDGTTDDEYVPIFDDSPFA